MLARSHRFNVFRALACGLAVASLASAALAAGPSTQLRVTGAVKTPKTYGLDALKALPAVTQTVSFGSGSGPQTHTFQGTSLWGVLDAAGLKTNPAVKNDLLNYYVLATGTDGYRTVYSLGELNPGFGNRPDLVAYAERVGSAWEPLGASGFVRTTAPGDVKGGRYVSNLFSLDVRSSGSANAGTGGGRSTSFTVSGDVKAGKTFDLAALKALPSTTLTSNDVIYKGVSLWDLLNSAVGISLNPDIKNDVLGKYVVATGSDGYKALFSLGELDPSFGNQPDLIAFETDGGPLGDDGFARLIVPNDAKGGRRVSNLISLEVFSAAAVPEPATAVSMLLGMGVVGAAWRRQASLAR